ncbi:hypothetical protein PROFUN_05171 [Planoprotostelium fungivorum]|uniref:HMA domain-containing protein n=1 Tax=Planoprotostelium fungivorum TaxID=1890364 RepID=A0A2P6N691_9EUKA|nr:hypothetical protein PROFUN_12602 [Planoprotostelium fungivorum]PRP86533.1 hypothetical protein PROFUN_05171 [Planoprotostelium fungivorum]
MASSSQHGLLTYAAAISGGLLSSSCCVVQLVLNYFSIGCAGFSVLDPFRNTFLSITYGTLFYKVWRDQTLGRGLLTRENAITSLIVLALSVSPTVVRSINHGRLSSEGDLIVKRVEITGMNCESCANSVRNGMMKLPGVEQVRVELKDKSVTIWSKREVSL